MVSSSDWSKMERKIEVAETQWNTFSFLAQKLGYSVHKFHRTPNYVYEIIYVTMPIDNAH